mmetsp:Transcript_5552/g.9906  ORF Transcript_5552/g.9906 Transcript_5552/m.9906 type:complete len:2248 (-) Transcript_5552:144-6887(-)
MQRGPAFELFLKLSLQLLELCQVSMSPSQSMIDTFVKFTQLAVDLHGVLKRVDRDKYEQLGDFLLNNALPYLEGQKQYDACTEIFRYAERETTKGFAGKLVYWLAKSSFDSKSYPYSRVRIVFCTQMDLFQPGYFHVLDELVSSFYQPLQDNTISWIKSGPRFYFGKLCVDLLNGRIAVDGAAESRKLPPEMQCVQDLFSLNENVFTIVPKKLLVGSSIDNSVQLRYNKEERIQISVHRSPLLSETKQEVEKQFTNLVELFSVYETPERHRVHIPKESSNSRMSSFSVSKTGEECKVSAVRMHSGSGRCLRYVPHTWLGAYLPAALLEEGYTFWTDSSNCLHGEKEGKQDLRILPGPGVSRGDWVLDCHPPEDVIKVFGQIEDAGFILFWRKQSMLMVELPRLNLIFVRKDHDTFALVENPTLFVHLGRQDLSCLKGLQRTLVLGNAAEQQTLVLPGPMFVPICTMQERYICKHRHPALCIFMEKLAAKVYNDAFDIATACATDKVFSSVERSVFDSLAVDDMSPEACACRLKLYEATILRNREHVPKNGSVTRDAVRYISAYSHMNPRLRLDDACVKAIVVYALGEGRRKRKSIYMANTTSKELFTYTDVMVLEGFLSNLEQRTAARPVPYHGGGGWHQLQSVAFGKLEHMFDLDEKGNELARLNLPPLKQQVPLVEGDIGSWLESVLEKGSFNVVFATLLECIKDDDSGMLGFVQLVSMRFYLMLRATQYTTMWETGAFLFMAALSCGVHLPALGMKRSPIKAKAFEKIYDNVVKPMAQTWPGFSKKILNNTFVPVKGRNSMRLEKFGSSWRRSRQVVNGLESNMQLARGHLLKNSIAYRTLVERSQASQKSLDQRAERGEDRLFPNLKTHELVKNFPPAQSFLSRVEKDCKMFDEAPEIRRFSLCCDDVNIHALLKSVDEEVISERQKIERLVRQANQLSKSTFSELELLANWQPDFTLHDLLGLLFSQSGIDYANQKRISLDVVVEAFVSSTVLQQLGRVRQALTSLLKSSDEQLPASKELLLDALTVERYHADDIVKLCFEYEAGFILRKSQVELVDSYTCRGLRGENICRQMKMGEGKSSTIFPLLGLYLTQGKGLTILAVPEALVEMSYDMLVRSLSNTFDRRVTMFSFSRDTLPTDENLAAPILERMLYDLKACRDSFSVLLTTAASLKAFVLKFVEESLNGKTSETFTQIAHILSGATLLLDECDVSFDPLKSELNFPIGVKDDLAHRNLRVQIALQLIHGLFDVKNKGIIDSGLSGFQLQGTPHLVLVDETFYRDTLTEMLASQLGEWLSTLLREPDSLLTLLSSERCQCVKTDSTRDDDHAFKNVLLGDPEFFWCSKENPKTACLLFKVKCPKESMVGACDIRFRPYSSFVFASGLSMLPSRIKVSVSIDRGKTFQFACESGEFVKRRLYFPPNGSGKDTLVKIELEGSARWFAIENVRFLYRPTAALTPATISEIKTVLLANSPAVRTELCTKYGMPRQTGMLLSIANEYINIFLPHCLGKVNSVSYGLVPDDKRDSPDENGLSQSATRRFMSVPFIGKDTPSPASEFSHPDILILLTLLSYRYGGLRLSDAELLVKTLQLHLKHESGPVMQRPSYLTFDRFLNSSSAGSNNVLPLNLFQTEDKDSIERLWVRIHMSMEAVEYYCVNIAFPRCLDHRMYKLKATGEELLLACKKSTIGMSGTPNAAIPLRMGKCEWEALTEGRFIRTLSRAQFVSVEQPLSQRDSKCTRVLERVASIPNAVALVDCGALIVGMSNEDVARYLLEKLRPSIHGVVYLDNHDRKTIVSREGRVCQLESTSIELGNRFTFYDQVHTTGMDILQPSFAHAVLTLNKTTTFRDFAQGAWRMRRLGKGQTVTYVLPQTVERLLKLENMKGLSPAQEIIAFLMLNTVRSMHAQDALMYRSQLCSVWRNRAWESMLSGKCNSAAPKVFKTKVSFDFDQAEDIENDEKLALEKLAKKHAAFISTKEDKVVIRDILSKALGKKKDNPARRFLRFLWGKLDSEQQQERVHLQSEQQQEREKDKQAQAMFDIENIQPRAWVGQRYEESHWQIGQIISSGSFDSFVDIRRIQLEDFNCTDVTNMDGVMFSPNHTLQHPPTNSRLSNVETVFKNRDTGHTLVVSLNEAATLRWKFLQADEIPAPFQLSLSEHNIDLLGHADFNASPNIDPRLQLIRFFNVSQNFLPEQGALLVKILERLTPEDRLKLFALSKRMRRRTSQPSGYETSDTSPIAHLFSSN